MESFSELVRLVKEAIESNRIKPLCKIGDIDYYGFDEMKRLVDQMREEKR
jgi:hypothetical protein